MDLRRLRAGEWIVAVSGVALFVSLFLPWYAQVTECVVAPCPEVDHDAWEALAVNDVILAIVAIAGVALFLITATQRVPAVPIAFESMLTALAGLATALVLVRVVWLPDIADARAWGLWVGLASAVGVTAGGWIGVRDDRMAGAPPRPEAEALPAPRS